MLSYAQIMSYRRRASYEARLVQTEKGVGVQQIGRSPEDVDCSFRCGGPSLIAALAGALYGMRRWCDKRNCFWNQACH